MAIISTQSSCRSLSTSTCSAPLSCSSCSFSFSKSEAIALPSNSRLQMGYHMRSMASRLRIGQVSTMIHLGKLAIMIARVLLRISRSNMHTTDGITMWARQYLSFTWPIWQTFWSFPWWRYRSAFVSKNLKMRARRSSWPPATGMCPCRTSLGGTAKNLTNCSKQRAKQNVWES